MHVVFGGDVELDAHIDVLITPSRMRLILLPTRGMPTADAVIVEDFLFERGTDGDDAAAAVERRALDARPG